MHRKEAFAVVLVSAVLAIGLTWPIAARMNRGGRVDSGDGRYSVWNVAWVAHALTTNPWHLYDANIFDPHPNALAFSEANLVAGVMAVPAWLATKNPYTATNSVILMSFMLSAICTYVLVRRLTGSAVGAAFSAIAFAYCPFVYAHIPHMQLLMTFGLPLVLLRLHIFVDGPSVKHAIWLGATMALAGLACGYYGVFAGLMAGLGVLWFGITRKFYRDPYYWIYGAGAAAVALLIIAPFYAPYLEIQDGGFGRSLDDASSYSAGWRAYLASPILLHRWMLPLLGTWRDVLFPGFLSIGFAIVYMLQRSTRQPPPHVLAPGVLGFYLLLGGLAMWASVGPTGGLYSVLHETMPFFSMLRAPARFGLLVTLAVAVIAGAGFSNIGTLFADRRRGWVAAGIVMATMARSTAGPLKVVDAPPLPVAHQRLAGLPRGPVAEFPYFAIAGDRHRHTEYMLFSTFHWKPLINGYSDHIPGEAFAEMAPLSSFPSLEAWEVLHAHRARYIVLHWNRFTPEEHERITTAMPRLRRLMRAIVEQPDASLFEVVRWPRRATLPDGGDPFEPLFGG
jgi:hypothetical protein